MNEDIAQHIFHNSTYLNQLREDILETHEEIGRARTVIAELRTQQANGVQFLPNGNNIVTEILAEQNSLTDAKLDVLEYTDRYYQEKARMLRLSHAFRIAPLNVPHFP